MVCVRGFWQNTCFFFFMAAADTAACRLSGVHTTKASISRSLSSSLRESLYAEKPRECADRPPLGAVVGVHDLLAGLTAGDAAGHLQGMGELNRIVRAEPIPA